MKVTIKVTDSVLLDYLKPIPVVYKKISPFLPKIIKKKFWLVKFLDWLCHAK